MFVNVIRVPFSTVSMLGAKQYGRQSCDTSAIVIACELALWMPEVNWLAGTDGRSDMTDTSASSSRIIIPFSISHFNPLAKSRSVIEPSDHHLAFFLIQLGIGSLLGVSLGVMVPSFIMSFSTSQSIAKRNALSPSGSSGGLSKRPSVHDPTRDFIQGGISI